MLVTIAFTVILLFLNTFIYPYQLGSLFSLPLLGLQMHFNSTKKLEAEAYRGSGPNICISNLRNKWRCPS